VADFLSFEWPKWRPQFEGGNSHYEHLRQQEAPSSNGAKAQSGATGEAFVALLWCDEGEYNDNNNNLRIIKIKLRRNSMALFFSLCCVPLDQLDAQLRVTQGAPLCLPNLAGQSTSLASSFCDPLKFAPSTTIAL